MARIKSIHEAEGMRLIIAEIRQLHASQTLSNERQKQHASFVLLGLENPPFPPRQLNLHFLLPIRKTRQPVIVVIKVYCPIPTFLFHSHEALPSFQDSPPFHRCDRPRPYDIRLRIDAQPVLELATQRIHIHPVQLWRVIGDGRHHALAFAPKVLLGKGQEVACEEMATGFLARRVWG